MNIAFLMEMAMPRKITKEELDQALYLMINEGKMQKDIHDITGLSRPFIRKLARDHGHVFPAKGGNRNMKYGACASCGVKLSRIYNPVPSVAHCSADCKEFFKGRKK